jgi:biopolymer transport protein ExbD
MAGDPGAQEGPITGINVTPLVDVTLVLLIIFLVTAKLIVGRQALPVDLPQAATGQRVQEIFSLVLSASGATELNGERLAGDDHLLERARAARSTTSELRAVIKADADVPHGRVIHTLDLLRQAGISKIGLGVEPLLGPAPALPAAQ